MRIRWHGQHLEYLCTKSCFNQNRRPVALVDGHLCLEERRLSENFAVLWCTYMCLNIVLIVAMSINVYIYHIVCRLLGVCLSGIEKYIFINFIHINGGE